MTMKIKNNMGSCHDDNIFVENCVDDEYNYNAKNFGHNNDDDSDNLHGRIQMMTMTMTSSKLSKYSRSYMSRKPKMSITCVLSKFLYFIIKTLVYKKFGNSQNVICFFLGALP